MSETIESKALWQALFDVQQEVDGIVKDDTNPHFKNSYASRTSILQVLKPLFAKHKLLLVQSPVPTPTGSADALALMTSIVHVPTGAALSATAVVPLPKSDPQGYGSALTYTSRYSIISMLGLPLLEDDDGEGARPAKTTAPKTASINRDRHNDAPETGTKAVATELGAGPSSDRKLWGK